MLKMTGEATRKKSRGTGGWELGSDFPELTILVSVTKYKYSMLARGRESECEGQHEREPEKECMCVLWFS